MSVIMEYGIYVFVCLMFSGRLSTLRGFGISIAEAMACGKSAIGSMKGGIPKGTDDGVTGFLIPPADTAAIAKRMHMLFDNPELRAAVGRNARERALHNFSWDVIVRELEGIFYELQR